MPRRFHQGSSTAQPHTRRDARSHRSQGTVVSEAKHFGLADGRPFTFCRAVANKEQSKLAHAKAFAPPSTTAMTSEPWGSQAAAAAAQMYQVQQHLPPPHHLLRCEKFSRKFPSLKIFLSFPPIFSPPAHPSRGSQNGISTRSSLSRKKSTMRLLQPRPKTKERIEANNRP